MYSPFFILHDWTKRSAEARSFHCAVLPKNKCGPSHSAKGRTEPDEKPFIANQPAGWGDYRQKGPGTGFWGRFLP